MLCTNPVYHLILNSTKASLSSVIMSRISLIMVIVGLNDISNSLLECGFRLSVPNLARLGFANKKCPQFGGIGTF